jgi:para-nitrobenzyl esterase
MPLPPDLPDTQLTSRSRSRVGTALAAAVATVLALGTILLNPEGSRALALPETVQLSTGAVRGNVTATKREFLGIPYAKPPTGPRRFRSPEPVGSWTGVRGAHLSGPACPQSYPLLGTLYPQNEDCLTVDVRTPATSATNLPVMVWFHGGAYLVGSSGSYDPTPLVTKGNVIVVEVNYRLGPFGYLALPELAAESATGAVGTYGLQDQQLALKWVRQNAAAFGGDPANVTIFGESAGGNSVCHQVASPLAAGLFQKAISQSGGCATSGLGPISKETAYERARAYATSLGCTDAATMASCLRGKSSNALLNSPTTRFESLDLTWVPVVDGSVVRGAPDVALREGTANDVRMILGTNHDEGRFFVYLLYHTLKLQRITPAIYTKFVEDHWPGDADAVLAQYPLSAYDTPDLAFATLVTDSSFACNNARVVRAAYRADEPLYQYEFAEKDTPLDGTDLYGMPLDAYHTSELYFLFSKVQDFPAALTPAQTVLSDRMIAHWTAFARTGNPNPAGTSAWPAWTPESPQAFRLTKEATAPFTGFEADHKCGFWSTLAD